MLLSIAMVFAALVNFSATASVQQSMQVDADTEEVKQIQDTSVTKRYGHWLFNGGFKDQAFSAVNPLYKISQGDQLLVQLWGGIDFQAQMTVDPQGNIFNPKVGPVRVSGVSNKKLNKVVLSCIKRVYKYNVSVYL